MARTRSIKPSFFKNEYLAECDPMARLLFVGLWTLADREGRVELRPLRIKAELFPYENCDVMGLVAQLAERGFVRAYESCGVRVLEIPKFGEHQRCHPDERSGGLPSPEEPGEPPVFTGENQKPGNPAREPGNPAREPGNFPATSCEVVADQLPEPDRPECDQSDECNDGPPRAAISAEKRVFPEGNAKPGNTAHEPGNFPANCALYLLPSSFNPSTGSAQSKIAPSKTAPRSGSKHSDPIRWSASAGWEGITEADLAEWSRAYPAADIPVELAKATQWLKANPKKARKSHWRRWLTTVWLNKCQDRGGTHREAARSGAPPPPDSSTRRYWRGDAMANMTDAEHMAWHKARALEQLAAATKEAS